MKETGRPRKDKFPLKLTDGDWQKTIEKWGKDNPETCPFFIKNYSIDSIGGDRRELVQKWRESSAEIYIYDAGEYTDQAGTLHRFKEGDRLLISDINGEQHEVMDSCQQPWCEATVDGLFNGLPGTLSPLEEKAPVVLLRGFGLGQQARLIFDQLAVRGAGELHIIELNNDVFENINRFLEECKTQMQSTFSYGSKSKIKIILHAGDAYQVTEQLVKEEKNSM